MNILIIGDKYEKGMKSKGCQALLSYNKQSNYIEFQHKTISSKINDHHIVYIYGFNEKKFVSYIQDQSDIKNIHTIHNNNFNCKNDVYSAYLSSNFLQTNKKDLLIIFGNTHVHKSYLQKIDRSVSGVFLDKSKQSNIGCIFCDGKIQNIGFDLDNHIENMYYITKNDSSVFLDIIQNPRNHNRFIFEIINQMIDQNITFKLY